MPDLQFQVNSASAVPHAASPVLAFQLEVSNSGGELIHAVVLRCQIQIETTRRKYTEEDQRQLRDLFGEPQRWAQTLRSTLWTHTQAVVPSFLMRIVTDLHVPCTFDFNVAATKYFAGLQDGDIPLLLMFSGSVFYEGPDGAFQVAPISWERETRFRLPLKVWRDLMDAYYPNSAWLCLRRDAFERLLAYKTLHGIPTWEEALERLMDAAEEVVPR
ncbi:MAG: DUF6084 family protein [Bryobacteraceae bacterium]